MKIKIIEKNPSHIKTNIFVDGALNGTLVFTHKEFEKFLNNLKAYQIEKVYQSTGKPERRI